MNTIHLHQNFERVCHEISVLYAKHKVYTFWTEARINFVKILRPTERNVKLQHFDFLLWGYPETHHLAITLVSELQMLGYFYRPDNNLVYSARNEVELMMTVLRKDSKTYREALDAKGMMFICIIL